MKVQPAAEAPPEAPAPVSNAGVAFSVLFLNRQSEVIPLCAPGGGAGQQTDQPQEATRALGGFQ